MSSESPTRQRLHLQGSFSSPEEKDMFLSRFEAARQLLVPGVTRNATISVLNALLDRVLQQTESVPVTRSGTSSSGREMMLDSAALWVSNKPFLDISIFQKDLSVLSLVLAWYPRQYMNFCLFAGLGEVKQQYIHSVYVDKLYQQIISDAVEESMKAVVDRVKANPDCITSGEQTVMSIFSTHRIVGIATLSRQDHRVAQTREVVCTKMVLPQVIARGLNITEVAHDYQATIKKYIEELGMMNSYDTWHGFGYLLLISCVENRKSDDQFTFNKGMGQLSQSGTLVACRECRAQTGSVDTKAHLDNTPPG
eukprot:Em0022g44a